MKKNTIKICGRCGGKYHPENTLEGHLNNVCDACLGIAPAAQTITVTRTTTVITETVTAIHRERSK